MNVRGFRLLAGITLSLLAAAAAQAQSDAIGNYPSRGVRVIDGYGAGGSTDLIARGIAQSLTLTFGQPIVVENRTGAAGIIAMEACAKAAPDGYTLCVPNNSQVTINPFVYAKLPYDAVRDFTPIINLVFMNGVVVVNPSVQAKSMSELVHLAKSKPGTLNWATYGNFSQLTLAWVQSNTGASFVQVPFKTSDQTLNSLLAGESQVLQINPGLVVRLIRAGKLRALAVGSSKRSTILPEVPSFAEVGLDLDLPLWVGLFAPAGTPKAIVQRLNTEIGKVIADPKFVERILTPLGAEPVGGSPEEFATFLKRNRELTEKLVRIAHLKPQ